MCLIAFALNVHPEYPLLLAANRDEFYDRPTRPAHFWEDHSELLGGRDLQAGGTWMALHTDGRMAAVTNYRDLSNIRSDARSRGDLPVNYLKGTLSAQEYLQEVHASASEYNGFNLLLYEQGSMYHYSNYEGKINRMDQGIFGISNALLDTPWPKVEQLKTEMTKLLEKDFDLSDFFHLLSDGTLADDGSLPDTGVGYEREKKLSAVCIRMDGYGTCSSSVIAAHRSGEVHFTERTHPVGNRQPGEVSFRL